MKLSKKLLAILMSVLMIFSMIAVPVSASAATTEDTVVEEIVGDETTTEEPTREFGEIFDAIRDLINAIHNIVGNTMAVFGKECAFCGELHEKDAEYYTVTFDLNYDGAHKAEEQKVKAGEYVVVPEEPEREGYVFVGWYTSNTYVEKFDFEESVSKDYVLYARWVDVTDKTDTDKDGLTDPIEIYLGTDPKNVDSDKDGLTDYQELYTTATDPLKMDTDDNGVDDAEEDIDNDSLMNKLELVYGTDPLEADTDKDGLVDNFELKVSFTDPLNVDTDGDGVTDGKEFELGTDPLVSQSSFEVVISNENDDSVKVSVEIELEGSQVDTLQIEEVENDTFFPETMPGYLGKAYDFSVEGDFDKATISFEFDVNELALNSDPTIYYFNEETQELEELPTTVEGNVAKAEVTHFSKYILVDRTIYEKSFSWIDVWDSTQRYTGVELVLVVDDSGSMTSNDRNYQRLSVAQNLINGLPQNSKIGIVKFASSTSRLTSSLTTDKDTAKSYLTTSYFKSSGGTYMYEAINSAFGLFETTDETIMKVVVVLSDGATSDTSKHSATVNAANSSHIKIYTVGLGSSTSYFNNYLKPLAVNTGGAFYLASNADQLSDIYANISQKIDIETDTDDDGIPDYYEDNMIIFSGIKLELDKNNPDTDGDGIEDGDELELKYEYNEDRTKVKVTGKLNYDPTKLDSDNDGFNDAIDPTPLDPVCYKNFDYYKNNNFADVATITIFVDQPYKNSREVINFDDKDEYVGHTFVGIDFEQVEEYAGFWPYIINEYGEYEGYGEKRAIKRTSVNGAIKMNGAYYFTYGNRDNVFEKRNYREKDHKWDVAQTYTISKANVGKLEEFAKNYKHQYNMVSDNCTTFAVKALDNFGINHSISQHKWTYGEGLVNWFAGTYYGYSPADAGEDIRISGKSYTFCDYCTLKDGSKVLAVYDSSYGTFSGGSSGGGGSGGGGGSW